jgi:tripartite-type tricarboxylate transporter receptor subunit TctC
VVTRLNEAVSKIVSQPDVQQAWAQQGAVPLVMNPPAFDKYVQRRHPEVGEGDQAANIKAE